MADTLAAKRILRGLPPRPFKVTSLPEITWDFHTPYRSSLFRGYLWDSVARLFYTDQGVQVTLQRAADDLKDGIYGMALRVDPAVGQVLDHGFKADTDLGTAWSLTFVLIPRWDTQPGASSSIHPFWHDGTNTPRFGYVENTGTIELAGWVGRTSGTPQSLTYALGWMPQQAMACTVTTSQADGKTHLYVNGTLRGTLDEAVKSNLAETLKMRRNATQSGVTGNTDLEAYFAHARALTANEVANLHAMFRTGFTGESRWVRHAVALAMSIGEMESLAWNLYTNNRLSATGGGLTQFAKDFNVFRKPDETDAALQKRLQDRLLQIFANGSIDQLIQIAAQRTGLPESAIVFQNLKDENGDFKPMQFTVQLPPGNDTLLADLLSAMQSAAIAGVLARTGSVGSFAWDVAGKGWDLAGFNYVR